MKPQSLILFIQLFLTRRMTKETIIPSTIFCILFNLEFITPILSILPFLLIKICFIGPYINPISSINIVPQRYIKCSRINFVVIQSDSAFSRCNIDRILYIECIWNEIRGDNDYIRGVSILQMILINYGIVKTCQCHNTKFIALPLLY